MSHDLPDIYQMEFELEQRVKKLERDNLILFFITSFAVGINLGAVFLF
tara:strand:+ start:2627 stop:2770 length:144 start_codon:yes stop_codon:yes gene_type:complete